MTEDEYKKLRKELESDYLALFKKTVAMHEIYLLRIAAHTKLREDSNFRVFLEYAKDVSRFLRILTYCSKLRSPHYTGRGLLFLPKLLYLARE